MFARLNGAFNARIRKFSKKVTHADLIDPDNGDHQDIALGTLPAGAVVLGRSVKINTYFTGGGATAVNVTIGTTGTPNAIMAGPLNIFDTTATGVPVQGTDGIGAQGAYGNVALVARVDLDASHNLLALTAGDMDIEVYYNVPDAA